MEFILSEIKEKLADEPKIAEVFENCCRNTLETTVRKMEDGTSFVITGDIPAMWLRDSAAQMSPFLLEAGKNSEIRALIEGLVRRQFFYINIDPYANAFNEKPDGSCWREDLTKRNDWVWERKFEVDSLCYPIWLSWRLWKNAGCTGQFDSNFRAGAKKILEVFRTEQYHESRSDYLFRRTDTYPTDTLSREGKGALVKEGTGMVWSGFRPSDDACTYGYLVPSNMFAVVSLTYLSEIAEVILKDMEVCRDAQKLAEEIRNGIETYGITEKEGFGRIYAYEVDGFGQYNLMDDANVPSLLSMSYLGYHGDREVEENTRKFILSEGNPYYYRGTCAAGIGSPHTPVCYIWHIALAMEGLTASSRERKKEIIDLMVKTDAGQGMMHEGFHADDAGKYTREWFSWANSMFAELVMDYCGYTVER